MIRSERGEKKLDWYIKWAASALVLSAIVFRSYFSFVGIFLWMWVSILWEDRALILLNGVGFAFLAVGIMKFHGAMWINFWSTLLWG